VDFIVEETGFGPATTEAHSEVAIGNDSALEEASAFALVKPYKLV
jgi:hypothetical protein